MQRSFSLASSAEKRLLLEISCGVASQLPLALLPPSHWEVWAGRFLVSLCAQVRPTMQKRSQNASADDFGNQLQYTHTPQPERIAVAHLSGWQHFVAIYIYI